MKALIMAGGQGSRLRPLTCDRPKPMVPVLNRPIMAHIMDLLARHGIRDVVVTLHPMPERVQAYFGDEGTAGLRLQYLVEDRPMGTAGSVARARPLVGDETLLIVSGDALTDVDLQAVLDFHRRRGAAATLVLKPVGDPSEYGIVITGPDGRVVRFLEKPSRGEVFSDHANTGIYVLEPQVVAAIPDGRPYDFSQEIFPQLLQAGVPLFGYITQAYWSDIGSPEQYRQAVLDALGGHVALRGSVGEGHAATWVAPDARLIPPVLVGEGCVIERGAEVGPFVALGNGCMVGRGATIRRSVLWDGCRVGPRAEVRGAVLADGAVVGEGARIFEGAIVGARAVIGEAAEVAPGVMLWPEKRVPAGQPLRRHLVWAGHPSGAVVGPSGVSGRPGIDLTSEMASGVAGALAAQLPPGSPVAVSWCGGRAARSLAWASAAGAATTGAEVLWLDGAVPAEVRELFRSRDAAEARPVAAVLALEHPSDDEPLRLELWDEQGLPLDARRARAVDGAFRRDQWRRVTAEAVGAIRPAEALREQARARYLERLVQILGELDAALPGLLHSLGLTVPASAGRVNVVVWAPPSSSSAAQEPSTTVLMTRAEELLVAALERVGTPWGLQAMAAPAADGAAGGIAATTVMLRLDPAGRRLLVWGPDGRPLARQQLDGVGALVLAALAATGIRGDAHGGAVRLPVDASDLAESVLRRLGVTWERRAPGDRALLDADPTLPMHPFGDAVLLGAALVLAVRAAGGVDALLAAFPHRPRLEATVPVSWDRMGRAMRQLAESAGSALEPPVDGLKVRHEQGWALVRPDSGAPLIRVQVEASTLDDARDLMERYVRLLRRGNLPLT